MAVLMFAAAFAVESLMWLFLLALPASIAGFVIAVKAKLTHDPWPGLWLPLVLGPVLTLLLLSIFIDVALFLLN